jgi:ferric-dicitrate binding protein FerR (iron transport regulator)
MSADDQELIERYLAGTAAEAESNQLHERLKRDDALMLQYLRHVNLTVALEAQADALDASRRLPKVPDGEARSPRTQRFAVRVLVAAAVLIVCGVTTVAWLGRGVPVEVLAATGAAAERFRVGEQLRVDTLSLDEGRLEVRLDSGVTLKIDAPASVQIHSAMSVAVASGKITVDAGEHGKGFVIETPQTRIVDLGTVFGVEASDPARTDVVVFQGQVELFEKGNSERVALLNQGEGLRIEKHRRASRIVSVTGSDASSSWSVREQIDPRAVITAVRDSMSANDEEAKKWPSLRNFYRIVPAGLHDGAPAFADENDSWTAVPNSLRGADLVQTFSADGFNWWMQLTLTVQQPCELFVMVDRRNDVPSWLKDEFADTGETVVLNWVPRKQPGGAVRQLKYGIWKRIVAQPGEIKLGAPYADPPPDRKSFQPNRMYGVAARPLP